MPGMIALYFDHTVPMGDLRRGETGAQVFPEPIPGHGANKDQPPEREMACHLPELAPIGDHIVKPDRPEQDREVEQAGLVKIIHA